MLILIAFILGGSLGMLIMAMFAAGAQSERRIRHEQEHEPVADDLRAAEFSHAPSVSVEGR